MPAAPSDLLAPTASGIDRRVLDQYRALGPDGGTELIQAILQAFVRSAEEMVTSMEAALATGNAEAYKHAVHSLKSSSANVGAMALSALCREFETLAKNGPLADLQPRWDALRDEYEHVRQDIDALLEGVE